MTFVNISFLILLLYIAIIVTIHSYYNFLAELIIVWFEAVMSRRIICISMQPEF